MDPDVFACEIVSFGNRPGDLLELPHASVQRQQTTDGRLAGFGLVAVKEPAAGLVDLGDGGGRGVAIARDAILHGLAPDGVAVRPLADQVFVRFHAAVGLDGGDADMLGRFPAIERFRALRAIGRIAHVPGEIRREACGIRAGQRAVQEVHLVGEHRGDRRELTAGSAFLFVDRRELRAGGIIDARRQAPDVHRRHADIRAFRITPGIVVISHRIRTRKRLGIRGVRGRIGLVRRGGGVGGSNEPARSQQTHQQDGDQPRAGDEGHAVLIRPASDSRQPARAGEGLKGRPETGWFGRVERPAQPRLTGPLSPARPPQGGRG